MKNSRKLDSPKRSIIDKKKKKLVNSDSQDNVNSDVLVSAVISPYLLTHLHHILQQSEYYAKKDGRKSTGLIAQELEKVLPNAIFTTNEINDDKEIKAIRYGNVVGLLVEAIKEQQEQIEELKAKLEEVA